MSPFYKEEIWGTESLYNLLKVIIGIKGRKGVQTQTMPPQYMFITIFLCCILLHLLPLDYLHLFPLGLGLDRPLSILEQRRGFFPLSVFHWKSLGGHYKSIGARPFIDYNDRLKRKHWMLTLLIMKISPLQKPIIN